MDDAAILAGLRQVSGELNKQFKAPVSVPGDELCVSDIPFFVPTSSWLFNKLLGGGVPVGRVMEIYGDPSTGKSTLIEHMMIGFQQYPGISVLLDADTGWYRPRALAMGHNTSRHLHLQADTIELGFETIYSTIARIRMPGSKFPRTMPVGIFWDAISSSQTEGEKEGDQYKEGMQDAARKIRKELRRIAPILPRNNCALIFASHTHVDIKAAARTNSKQATPKKSSSYGDAIKFWSAKRLKVWVAGALDVPSQRCGVRVMVNTYKDKINVPNRIIDLPMLHMTGVHRGYELINYLVDNSSWVNMNGAYVCIPDFPEPGKEINFFPKHLDLKLQRFPGLLEYLECCAEETWAKQYGV
jgi:RecA/RadA recombinase